ncbi:4-hydroxyphenylacetate 3-monooxygenase, reductase component [Paraburkholderia tropica]|uniref:4-hydroxyphenylacetate 3-monooxygenase, reductase component n=1 Tax=Paraburkholderia tropica TaxID=92647 RepID=UPI002AB114DC|nr:4-hydroxyphenylacetate 3-monooxygenase, reductase component [Paraburkholderia tropica]
MSDTLSTFNDVRAEFRQAMAHLCAAVNVVTTDGSAGRCGVTASAVCSVTDTPPTLLLCLNRSSAMHSVFEANRRLCVNVLPGEHEELARHFAGMTSVSMKQRFDLPGWRRGDLGVPVLNDALVSIEGEITEMKEVGSHSVIFVRATKIRVRDDGDSLVYYSRGFHRVARPTIS